MEMKLEKCTTATYSLFLQIANEAFEKTEPEWFPKNCGHIYPFVDDKKLSNYVGYNYISYYGDEPAGTIGIYPIDMSCEGKVIKCAGIGAVGVIPAFRNLGIMNYMLNEVMRIIKEENYDLSWLVGERLRYKRFGYDLGGKTLIIEMNKKSFKDIMDIKNLHIKTPKVKDLEVLDNLYRQYNNRVLRSRELWERQIGRENLVWKLLNRKAYLVYDIKNPQEVQELAGDWENVISLLKEHYTEHNLKILSISMPYEINESIQKLVNISSNYKLISCDQFTLINDRSSINISEIRYCSEVYGFKNNKSSLSLYISPIDKV